MAGGNGMGGRSHGLDRPDKPPRKGKGNNHDRQNYPCRGEGQGQPLLTEEPDLYRVQKMLWRYKADITDGPAFDKNRMEVDFLVLRMRSKDGHPVLVQDDKSSCAPPMQSRRRLLTLRKLFPIFIR
jgi:hypothetical protein